MSDTISQKANASDLTAHANNTDIHVTSKDKTTWNAKQNALSTAQLNACNSGITSDKVSQYDEYIGGASGQPVGSVLWVMGSTVPAGYLICNGSAVSRTAYAKLFQAIGTKYGEGDGNSTFNLPNLIDRFLQGSETSGNVKEAGLPNITGHIAPNVTWYYAGSPASGSFRELGANNPYNSKGAHVTGESSGSYGYDFDASRSSSIYGNSATVQPPAITSIPCIRAFDSVIDATTVSVAQLSDTKVNKAGDTMTGSLTAPSFVANGIDCSVDSQGDGYIRYSNGIQICWGVVRGVQFDPYNGYYGKWVSFPKNFLGAEPVINISQWRPSGNLTQNVNIMTPTNSCFLIETDIHGGVYYIAIGKWK